MAEESQFSRESDNNNNRREIITKKIIKILTVVAYVSGVTGVGFLMSLYYLVFWDPQINVATPSGYPRYPRDDPLFRDGVELRYERSVGQNPNGINSNINQLINAPRLTNEIGQFIDGGGGGGSFSSKMTGNEIPSYNNYESLPILTEDDSYVANDYANDRKIHFIKMESKNDMKRNKEKSYDNLRKKIHFEGDHHKALIRHSSAPTRKQLMEQEKMLQ